MKNKYCYIDAEYNGTTEKNLNLVCCTIFTESEESDYWLHNEEEEKKLFLDHIRELHKKGYIFVSFNVQAEARAILSLLPDNRQLSVTKMKWIDLYLEYRCLTNHNNPLTYGKHLVKGKEVRTRPPKPKWMKQGAESNSKPSHSLSSAVYKLLKIKIDTVHKDMMRDLIISAPKEFGESDQDDIMSYCNSDVVYLEMLLKEIVSQYGKLLSRKKGNLKTLIPEMLLRGNFAARSAIMESDGYPINIEHTRNFSNSTQDILNEVCRDINSQFPNVMPFKYSRKENRFSMVLKNLRNWIKAEKFKGWKMTPASTTHPSGQLSLSIDAFKDYFPFRHDFPRDNLGAQMVRYLSMNQSLNGFKPVRKGKAKKNFWDSVGSDGRVRPYLNTYGAQSARSQPSATSFIPLKSAWMRSLIQPPEGKAICGIDYGSEEFLISALLSGDKNMIEAYASGDVYLYFAKGAGAVPKDGTKEEYSDERNKFKSTTLGISYDMSKYGLSKKLTTDLGRPVSEEEAQNLIDLFYQLYPTFYAWKETIQIQYAQDRFLKLPCGWYMWGDNINQRSTGNFPSQGMGSSIMRKAVELAQDAGLKVIFTLHDALYIEYSVRDEGAIKKLADCMRDAFTFYFEGVKKEQAKSIRLDVNIWSSSFNEKDEKLEMFELPVKKQKIYIDERSRKEYEKFSKYFNRAEMLELV